MIQKRVEKMAEFETKVQEHFNQKSPLFTMFHILGQNTERYDTALERQISIELQQLTVNPRTHLEKTVETVEKTYENFCLMSVYRHSIYPLQVWRHTIKVNLKYIILTQQCTQKPPMHSEINCKPMASWANQNKKNFKSR